MKNNKIIQLGELQEKETLWGTMKREDLKARRNTNTTKIKHEDKTRNFSPHYKNEVFLENLKSLVNCG